MEKKHADKKRYPARRLFGKDPSSNSVNSYTYRKAYDAMDTRFVTEWTTSSPGRWSFRESAMGIHHIIQTMLDANAEEQTAYPRKSERDPIFNHIRTEPDRRHNNPHGRLGLITSPLLPLAA